jgi:hypothetical protein
MTAESTPGEEIRTHPGRGSLEVHFFPQKAIRAKKEKNKPLVLEPRVAQASAKYNRPESGAEH